jgi:4-hydroxybenzoate polyprenyltransferase
MNTISGILAAYIVTLILAKGSIFNQYRQWLIDRTPYLQKPAMKGEGSPQHYLVCRLCLGLIVSALFAWLFEANFFILYGASYFMATQERL